MINFVRLLNHVFVHRAWGAILFIVFIEIYLIYVSLVQDIFLFFHISFTIHQNFLRIKRWLFLERHCSRCTVIIMQLCLYISGINGLFLTIFSQTVYFSSKIFSLNSLLFEAMFLYFEAKFSLNQQHIMVLRPCRY